MPRVLGTEAAGNRAPVPQLAFCHAETAFVKTERFLLLLPVSGQPELTPLARAEERRGLVCLWLRWDLVQALPEVVIPTRTSRVMRWDPLTLLSFPLNPGCPLTPQSVLWEQWPHPLPALQTPVL